MNVFTYGSLMYPSVWSRVVTGQYAKKAGVVHGFQRLAVQDEPYPGLIKGRGAVEGVIYFDISLHDLARLDHFEGELYQRDKVEIICQDGTRVKALVYVIRDQYKQLLGEAWSVEKFEQVGLVEFEARYVGFDRVA